jgi:acyl phosphate:glycerol-3-phosphate acyltransferase
MPDPNSWLFAALALCFGYALGSVPYGLIITRMAGTDDLRSIGSGNIGATNVLRTGRKDLAIATLLCDMIKGTLAVYIGLIWGPWGGLLAGLGAFLGHLFPVWLGFKGGKGVATYIGVLLGLWWPGMLIFAGVWGVVAYLSRYSSLSALVAATLTPIVLHVAGYSDMAAIFLLMTVLVFIMHRANIQRLLSGTEGRIGQKG